MANLSALDRTFGALADPTRRAMIGRLRRGPATVSELAEPFDMAMPSVLKHVRVLSAAGLVSTSKRGRVRMCALRPEALDDTARWIDEHRRAWETRLASLDAMLDSAHHPDSTHHKETT